MQLRCDSMRTLTCSSSPCPFFRRLFGVEEMNGKSNILNIWTGKLLSRKSILAGALAAMAIPAFAAPSLAADRHDRDDDRGRRYERNDWRDRGYEWNHDHDRSHNDVR